MRRVVVFLLGALLLSGCVHFKKSIAPTGIQYLDNQAKAEQIVWYQYYKMTIKPPVIEWRNDKCPDHPDSGALIYQDGTCYYGLFYGNLWKIYLAWRGSFSKSAYAHELLHAYLNSKGIYDPDHTRPEWNTMIPEANKLLENAGL